MKKITAALFLFLMFVTHAPAQSAEVTVSLNEHFFDALLDAIFTNLKTPSFAIAENGSKFKVKSSKLPANGQNSFISQSAADKTQNPKPKSRNPFCDETIRLQRAVGDVRTAVRFRDGKIFAPVAFAGSYSPPFVGCIDFEGYADTNIELEFDKQKGMLVGRAKVSNVVLSGTGGVGSSFIARLVQNSIDKKINPLQILSTDKLSFIVPVQNAGGALRMRATNIRTEVAGDRLNVYIAFEFGKG